MLPQAVRKVASERCKHERYRCGLIGGQPLMAQLQQARTEEERDLFIKKFRPWWVENGGQGSLSGATRL